MQVTPRAQAEVERILADHPTNLAVRLYVAGYG